jgi:outer membrane protein OmpA-like peptidoglycan-associated protein
MRNLFLLVVVFIILTEISEAQEIKPHPFSGRFVLTAQGGLTVGKTDYMETINSYTIKGLGEYFFQTRNENIFGLRFTAGLANIRGKDNRRIPNEFTTDIRSLGLGIEYAYSIKDIVFPYAYGGLSFNWFDPLMTNGHRTPNNAKNLYPLTTFSYDLEGGFRFRINNDWSVLAGGSIHFMQTDNLDDVSPANPGNLAAGPHYDFYAAALIGVSFSFPENRDSDGDGVPDSRDLCPDTPPGVLIDENGCPLDMDGDGVPDYLDQCSNTPRGVKVDKNGCPIDSDNDGVPDYLDKCPNTPAGISVDKNGCPPDSDGDGVPDYKDNCPDTPQGAPVDTTGCPLDSDGDGVPDYLDKCANTPKGAKVDQFGCEITEQKSSTKQTEKENKQVEKPVNPNINVPPPETKKENVSSIPANTSRIVISGDDTFQPNSSEIKASAYPNLNNIVDFLSKDPWTKWKIVGYVDAQTPDSRKLTLSYERADAILKYFIAKGLPSFQFQTFGLGDESPVASNSSPDGRSKNRRVELVKIKK